MKNASTYLYFKSQMAKLTDSEKFWLTNRMVYAMVLEPYKTDYDNTLEMLLRQPVVIQNTVEWWRALRSVSVAPLFYRILRQR